MPGSVNKYILMHKNISVAEMELDTVTGVVVSIGDVYEQEHMPLGTVAEKGNADRGRLNAWWQGRGIPVSRYGIGEALQEMKIENVSLLQEKCLGLSLSDQYWLRPAGVDISWEKVNFFENSFSEDIGNILFGKKVGNKKIDFMSPDNTSDGWLRKKWKIVDGKRCLLKGGSGATWQEPYNEVLASRMMERLRIPHVKYELLLEEEYPYSVCENFITPDTELISAWYIMQTVKKQNHVSVYQHYLDCCEYLGIPGIKEAVDRMLTIDYLIVNEDRHQNNFGVIRRAGTLEYIGSAPIYDSGTSLWFDKPAGLIKDDGKETCKPFKSSHKEQIKLVKDFDWLDFSALAGIEEELWEIVKGSLFVDEKRCSALCRGLRSRIKTLEKIALSGNQKMFYDDTQFDIAKDIAYHGKTP